MKKIFIFIIAACAMMQATSLRAQEEVISFNSGVSNYIPKSITKNDQPFFYIAEGLDGTFYEEADPKCELKIYDTNFNIVKELTIPSQAQPYKMVIEKRKDTSYAIAYDSINKGSYDILQIYQTCTGKRLSSDAIAKLTANDYYNIWKEIYNLKNGYITYDPDKFILKSVNGSTALYQSNDTLYSYYHEKFGTKYPTITISLNVGDKHMMSIKQINYDYIESYTGEWEKEETTYNESGNNYVNARDFDFTNIDKNECNGSMIFSQTLFNNDEKFEYLIPVYNEVLKLNYTEDRDYDGEIDYKEYYTNYEIKGYNIYSDNENIGFLNTPAYIYDIYIFGGNIYLEGEYYNYNEDCYYTHIYRFNKATNSIEQVSQPVRAKISVREEIVTIDFKEPTTEECELIVTSTDGRLCKKESIVAGSENIKYNTRAFTKGIYNFSVMQKGKVVENGKIIIR